jgi:flagellar assembly protein FliH
MRWSSESWSPPPAEATAEPATAAARATDGADGVTSAPAYLDVQLRVTRAAGGRGHVDRWLDHAGAAVSASIREEACAQGYAAGYAEGRRAAAAAADEAEQRRAAELAGLDRRRAAEFARALGALDGAAAGLERDAAVAAERAEQILVEAAFALAEAVLGRELELAADPGLDAVRRALALAPQGRPVTVRVNPADARALGEAADWQGGRQVTVVADSSVAAGDCVADCDAAHIDARIGPALDRVREVLLG